MKIHRKYLDVCNLLNGPNIGLNYIRINKNGTFITNGHFVANFPLESPDEFTFNISIFISAGEAATVLKLIPKNFPYLELIQEEGKFYFSTHIKEMRIPIENDITDSDFPNIEKHIDNYNNQEPKLSITFDANYIKVLAEQLIKFSGVKESQPWMEFNFYDLENLEKGVEIKLVKDSITKANIILMPLKTK